MLVYTNLRKKIKWNEVDEDAADDGKNGRIQHH